MITETSSFSSTSVPAEPAHRGPHLVGPAGRARSPARSAAERLGEAVRDGGERRIGALARAESARRRVVRTAGLPVTSSRRRSPAVGSDAAASGGRGPRRLPGRRSRRGSAIDAGELGAEGGAPAWARARSATSGCERCPGIDAGPVHEQQAPSLWSPVRQCSYGAAHDAEVVVTRSARSASVRSHSTKRSGKESPAERSSTSSAGTTRRTTGRAGVDVDEREQLGGDHRRGGGSTSSGVTIPAGSRPTRLNRIAPTTVLLGIWNQRRSVADARCRRCVRRGARRSRPPPHPSGGEVHRARRSRPGGWRARDRPGRDHLAAVSPVDPVEHGVEEVVAVVVRLHAVGEVDEAGGVGAGRRAAGLPTTLVGLLVELDDRITEELPRARDRSEGARGRGRARAGGPRSASRRRRRGRGPSPPARAGGATRDRFSSSPSSTSCFRRRISSMVRSAPARGGCSRTARTARRLAGAPCVPYGCRRRPPSRPRPAARAGSPEAVVPVVAPHSLSRTPSKVSGTSEWGRSRAATRYPAAERVSQNGVPSASRGLVSRRS